MQIRLRIKIKLDYAVQKIDEQSWNIYQNLV